MSIDEAIASYPEWVKAIANRLIELEFKATPFSELPGNGLVFSKDHRSGKKKTLILTFQRQRLGNFISSLKNVVAISRETPGSVEALLKFPVEAEFLEHRSKRIRGIKIVKSVNEIDRYSSVIVHEHFYAATGMSPKQISKSRSVTKCASFIVGLGRKINVPKPTKKIEFLIHIRSGDIFGHRPHRGYAQPPLAFYQRVVNDAKPKTVALVFEDFGNPVIKELISFLHSKSIEIRIIGADLEEVVHAILKSKIVLFGTGTFATELLSLSRNIALVYFLENFGRVNSEGWLKKVEKAQYSCTSKEIHKLLPWENLEFQRDIMLSMEPESFIRKI